MAKTTCQKENTQHHLFYTIKSIHFLFLLIASGGHRRQGQDKADGFGQVACALIQLAADIQTCNQVRFCRL